MGVLQTHELVLARGALTSHAMRSEVCASARDARWRCNLHGVVRVAVVRSVTTTFRRKRG
eukprot:1011091-Alexandrium_andersonii.AAC.1